MSGYAASARLHGGSTRFVAVAADRQPTTDDPVATPPERLHPGRVEPERVEPAWRPVTERLAARWDDVREAWSQTTFYLFDPESWR